MQASSIHLGSIDERFARSPRALSSFAVDGGPLRLFGLLGIAVSGQPRLRQSTFDRIRPKSSHPFFNSHVKLLKTIKSCHNLIIRFIHTHEYLGLESDSCPVKRV
jgi:hypothetical protein